MASQNSSISEKQATAASCSLTANEAPPSPYDSNPTSKSRPKSWAWHLFSQLVSLLWLGPIITLLVLNFRNHVIGASIWCPFGKCASDAFGDNAIATAVRLDKKDRDVLASLQFVAQAFEIWFLMIATALLYDVAMIFARSPGGLPVGYLWTYLEFSDVKNLVNPLLWTSAFPSRHDSPTARKRRGVAKLFLFALLAAFLTILTNLMGAATAVLLIPSLQWVETERVPQQRFNGLALSQPPQGDVIFAGSCSDAQLSAGNFSCTSNVYGPSLDEWAASALSSTKQFEQPYGTAILATSQESAVQFALNASSDLEVIWVANRQVLRDLSQDYLSAIGVTHNYLRAIGDTDDGLGDARFNKSLQNILQRTGPSIGVQANCYAGNVSVTKIADDKEVHCFSRWSPDEINYYTKCFRVGEGFNLLNTHSRFWLGADHSVDSATAVDSYFSDLATYHNETDDFGSGILSCLANATAPSCNWDNIFTTPLPQDLKNSSVNVGLISYSIPNPPPTSQARIYCDTVARVAFPTYTLDTSLETNMLHLVQLDKISKPNPVPLVMNPDWFLAAWSIDRNGTVPGNRQLARELSHTLRLYWDDPSDLNTLQLFLYHIYPLGQAMSMVNYHHTTPNPAQTPTSQKTLDPIHPIFVTYAQLHVWAWGLSGRTSKLGVVIAIAGCICVIARFFLGLCHARREHSPVEILMALEHDMTGSPAGCVGMKEREMARLRYRLREDGDGRARFVQEKSKG